MKSLIDWLIDVHVLNRRRTLYTMLTYTFSWIAVGFSIRKLANLFIKALSIPNEWNNRFFAHSKLNFLIRKYVAALLMAVAILPRGLGNHPNAPDDDTWHVLWNMAA